MTRDEMDKMAEALRHQGLTLGQTMFAVSLVLEAIHTEREACAKVCDLALLQCQETINELDETEHIAQCFVQGAMTQLVKLSKAIRARGQA